MTPEAFEGDVARLRERMDLMLEGLRDEIGLMASQPRFWKGHPGLAQVMERWVNKLDKARAALEAGAERDAMGMTQADQEAAITHDFRPGAEEPKDPYATIDWHSHGLLTPEEQAAHNRNLGDAIDHLRAQEPPPPVPPQRCTCRSWNCAECAGEPKRGRGVDERIEALLLAMCRPDYEIVKMCVNHWHPDLQEIRAAYRAERAEARRDFDEVKRDYDEVKRRLDYSMAAHTALQSTHEALVQKVGRAPTPEAVRPTAKEVVEAIEVAIDGMRFCAWPDEKRDEIIAVLTAHRSSLEGEWKAPPEPTRADWEAARASLLEKGGPDAVPTEQDSVGAPDVDEAPASPSLEGVSADPEGIGRHDNLRDREAPDASGAVAPLEKGARQVIACDVCGEHMMPGRLCDDCRIKHHPDKVRAPLSAEEREALNVAMTAIDTVNRQLSGEEGFFLPHIATLRAMLRYSDPDPDASEVPNNDPDQRGIS